MYNPLAPNRFIRSSLLLLAAAMPVHANLYWDGTTTTADADGGGGTWDTTSTNWDSAATAGADTVWSPTETAVFGGTAGTVTVATGGITAVGLDFTTTGYTVSGAGLTLSAGTVRVGSGAATVSSVIAGTNGLTKTGSGSLTLSAANTYSGVTTLSTGILIANTLAGNGTNSSIGTGTSLVLDGGTFRHTTASVGGFNRLITLSGDSTIDLQGANFLFLTGVISGPASLTKTGPAQAIVSGANTYQGETFVNQGELQFRNLSALGATAGGTTVADTARVCASVNGTIAENFSLNGNGGNGLGALQCVDNATITYSGSITLQTNSGIGGTRPLTITGVISGPGGLLKLGPTITPATAGINGVTTIAGTDPNTYQGVTTLGGKGKLVLDKPDGVIAIPGNLNLASIAWNGQNAGVVLASNEQIANTSILTWSTTASPTGGTQEDSFFRLNGYTETIGGLVSAGNGGKAAVENRGSGDTATYGVGTLIIDVADGASYSYNGGIRDMDGGSNGGKVAVTKTGPGTQILSGGMNNATGPLLVNAGILRVNNNIGSATVNVTGTGRLEGAGGTLAGASINAHTGGTLAPGTAGGTGTLTVASAAQIGNGGTLALGTGTLSGSAVVTSGGTVTGTGTVTGALTVQAGGQFTPGTTATPVGAVAVNGALSLSGTSTFQIGKTGTTLTSDSVTGFSSAALGGNLAIEFVAGSDPLVAGDSFRLFDSPSATFSGSIVVSGLPNPGTGLQWETSNLATNGSITVVDTTSTPGFSPSSGGYVGSQSVTITSDSGATIYYTVNGTDPTPSSPVYTTPVTVPDNTVGYVIKAIAKHPDFGFSAIATATYNTVSGSTKWNVDGAGNWTDAFNWQNLVVPNGTGILADFSVVLQTGPGSVVMDGNRTAGSLIFGNAPDWTLSGTSVLTLDTPVGSPIVQTNVPTTISAVLGGIDGFTKTGSATLTSSAAHTYTGETVISAGTVKVGNLQYNGTPSPLGAGANLVFDGGTLDYTGGDVRVDQLSKFNRNIVLNANGGTIITGGTTAGFFLAEGPISGPGGFTKTGLRQLILVNGGTYEGVTNINQGEIQFRSLTSFGSATAGTIVASGAQASAGGGVTGTVNEPFTLNGNGLGNGALQSNDGGTVVTYAGAITLASNAGIGGGQPFTISGPISGPGGLTKLSANVVTVTGPLTYMGTTTVSAGTLQITGTTTVPLVVATGAIISPGGAAIGTFTAGNTEINGTYAFQVSGATGDSLVVDGNLDIDGATLTIAAPVAPTADSYVVASYTGNLIGRFIDPPATVPVGYKLTYDETNKKILLSKQSGFANWATTNGLSGTDSADFDHDGLQDAVEYVLGTDPKASTGGAPALTFPGGGNMVFTFNRDHRSLSPDVTVAVEVGTALTSWPTVYPVGTTSSGSVTVTPGATVDVITVTVPMAPDTAKFARLKVTVAATP